MYGLPVRQSFADGLLFIQSMWRPTPEELEQLNAGGAVVVTLCGSQPPIQIDVADAAPLREPV